MTSQQENIIDLFEDNELQIGLLYKLYAQKIPGQKSFWLQLSMEEVSHAADIRAAYQKNSDALFKENKFTRGVLRYVMDFVEKSLMEARQQKINHSRALETALRIEQSILEKKCFDFFLPTNKQLKAVLERLNHETENHVERLRQEYKKAKIKKRKTGF